MSLRSLGERALHRLPPVQQLVEERDRLRERLAREKGPDVHAYGYLFVVTYGRSGSTLLNGVLNSIPGYVIRGENRFVIYHLYEWHRSIKTEQDNSDHMRAGPRSPWYGIRRYPRDKELEGMRRLMLTTVLRPGPKTRVMGFKEIRWPVEGLGELLEFVTHLFPEARFLFNVRDPHQVAKSKWWANVPDAVAQIERREDRWRQVRESLGDRAFLVRYDDYVADPASLRSLFDWLGEPFDEAAIRKVLSRPHGY